MTADVDRLLPEHMKAHTLSRQLLTEREQLNAKVSQANARILELEAAARLVINDNDGMGFTGDTPCPVSEEVGRCVACDYRPLCEALADVSSTGEPN